MDGKRQFSLGYLMLEVFWVSLAIGPTRHIVLVGRLELMPDEKLVLGAAIIADILIIPIAISGLVGRMRAGAVCGFALLILLGNWALFLPAVQ